MTAVAAGPGEPMLTSSRSPGHPGVLLDRDGTIIVDHGYVGSVDRVEFIDGAADAIAAFNRAGIPVAVVTNQAGWPEACTGWMTWPGCTGTSRSSWREHGAHVDLFLYCPYHPAGVVEAFARTSEDRKPRPGMAKAAEAALNLDLTASWVVGDRPEDIGLAEAVGASAIYLGTGECRAPRRLVVPEPGCRRPVHPGADRDMSSVHDLRPSRLAADGSAVKFPMAAHTRARRRTSTPMRRRWPGRRRRSTPRRSTAPRPSCSRPTPAGPGCSPAATAARRRSPTTCSATT